MQRISNRSRATLNEEEQEIWDRIDKTRGGVWGPYSVLMHTPKLAERVASVGEYLRFHGALSDSERELAILCAARESGSQFEWAIHEPLALKFGLSKEAIECIRTAGRPGADDGALRGDLLERRQILINRLITELSQERKLSDAAFADAQSEFSNECLIEIMVIAGFYRLLAFVLQGFDVPSPPAVSSLLDS